MSATTSMALASIWAWLIPHFYIEFSEWWLAILELKPPPPPPPPPPEEEDGGDGNDDHRDDHAIRRSRGRRIQDTVGNIEHNDADTGETNNNNDNDNGCQVEMDDDRSEGRLNPTKQQRSDASARGNRIRQKTERTESTFIVVAGSNSCSSRISFDDTGLKEEKNENHHDDHDDHNNNNNISNTVDSTNVTDNEDDDNDSIQDIIDENVDSIFCHLSLDNDDGGDNRNFFKEDKNTSTSIELVTPPNENQPASQLQSLPQPLTTTTSDAAINNDDNLMMTTMIQNDTIQRRQKTQKARLSLPSSSSSSVVGASSSSSSFTERHQQAAIRGSGMAVLIIIIVYTASGITVAMLTRNMDRKASAIVVGLGRIMSAFLFAVFSVYIPMWLGVTYSSTKHTYHKQIMQHTAERELTFRVSWSMLGHFWLMYCIMLLYFCGNDGGPLTIPISTIMGIMVGFVVVWLVWLGQTRFENHRRLVALVGSSTIAVASSAAFAAGCWYVKEVWYEGQDIGYKDDWTWFVFFGWLTLCLGANYIYYRLTRRKLAAAAAAAAAAASVAPVDTNSLSNETTDNQTNKSKWRYHAKIFEPPESFCGAATELGRATGQAAVSSIRALQPNLDNMSVISGGRKNRARTNTFGSTERPSPRFDRRSSFSPNGDKSSRRRAMTAPEISTTMQPPIESNVQVPLKFDSPLKSPSQVDIVVGNRKRTSSNVSSLADDEDDDDDFFKLQSASVAQEARTSFQKNNSSRLMDESPSNLDLPAGDDPDERTGSPEERDEPSLWLMMKTNSCCGRRKFYNAPRRKPWERAINVVKWVLWTITSAFHVYLTVIFVGATFQQNNVRAALPSTYSYLYPDDYVTGTMCAWNESTPNADIRTFDTIEEVYAANYSVVHCGACNKCSNWNDLELQWTTRSYLAEIAQDCTKEILGRGTAEDVQQCNMDEIGFTEECSWCWTEDQLCAKKNCVFIYFQSLIINQVSNFNVGPDDITSATCDEAICGPEFVPCSGATRRRMNIVSDIPRPADQQCTVATENWTEVFDYP